MNIPFNYVYVFCYRYFSCLRDKYVIVPADKASNDIVFVCKSYYFECLIKELGINSNTASNTTYKPTSFDKDEILANHRSFITSLNIPWIFQICAAIYQLLLHMVFTSRNWFVMQGPVAIIPNSWNVIFIWETGYWTRAIQRFALFDLLKSLYSCRNIFRLCRDDNKRWIFI
jgi:hypothetical protein